MGPCCCFCGSHCFVSRLCPGQGQIHMATCRQGKAFDLAATGYDADTAYNVARLNDLALATLVAYVDKASAEVAEIASVLDHWAPDLAAEMLDYHVFEYLDRPELPLAHRKAAVRLLRHEQAKHLSRAFPDLVSA